MSHSIPKIYYFFFKIKQKHLEIANSRPGKMHRLHIKIKILEVLERKTPGSIYMNVYINCVGFNQLKWWILTMGHMVLFFHGISNAYTLDIVLILVIYTVGELLEYKKRSLTFKFAVLWPNHMVFFAPYLVR